MMAKPITPSSRTSLSGICREIPEVAEMFHYAIGLRQSRISNVIKYAEEKRSHSVRQSAKRRVFK